MGSENKQLGRRAGKKRHYGVCLKNITKHKAAKTSFVYTTQSTL